MNTSTKAGIAVVAVLGALVMYGGGAASGTAMAAHFESPAKTASSTQGALAPCNLRLAWDRVDQRFQAIYTDSTTVEFTPKYGRTANLSCTDVDILTWQQQRRAAGQDDRVCRPVIFDDEANGTVYPIGCAVPKVVVSGELR